MNCILSVTVIVTQGRAVGLKNSSRKLLNPRRNGWGASAVDALTTALVMQQKDVVNQIIEYIPTIDFTKTSSEVSLFETTIRYLGGMVSGYDFLTGPLAGLADNVLSLLNWSASPY